MKFFAQSEAARQSHAWQAHEDFRVVLTGHASNGEWGERWNMWHGREVSKRIWKRPANGCCETGTSGKITN